MVSFEMQKSICEEQGTRTLGHMNMDVIEISKGMLRTSTLSFVSD